MHGKNTVNRTDSDLETLHGKSEIYQNEALHIKKKSTKAIPGIHQCGS